MLLKMSLRNILRNRRRSLLTGIMMLFGMVIVSYSLALTDGTYNGIIDIFTTQHTGHVQVVHKEYIKNRSIYKTITNYKDVLNKITSDKQVKAVAPRIFGGALGFHKTKTLGLEVVGIHPKLEDQATGIQKRILKGNYFELNSEYEALIGKKVAKILKLELGDELVLISQGADGSIANDLFKVKAIVGTKDGGKDDYRVYLPLNTATEFYSLYNQVHEISIVLGSIKGAVDFTDELQLKKPLIARPWQIVEAEFYKAMEMDKQGNMVTLFILILMVGVSVLNTVLMSTLERTREFGVLKALGTQPRHLFSMIVSEAIILSLMSVFVGAFISFGLNYYSSIYGFKFDEPMSIGGMMISEFNSELSVGSIFYPGLMIVFTAIIASLYPAIKASKIGVSTALGEH
ncbi:MAG: ABC transporter permease [Bdellovibrionaceae bacterium]|jgi:putative ABC transport system permease protein|nr:ABC transporter permease [Pseudobdellovibrionaceae bacterium]